MTKDFMTIVPRCKLLIIGESNTGKTSIVQRFLNPNQSFNKKYNMTTGVTISSKQIKLNKSNKEQLNNQSINKLTKVVSFEDDDNDENLDDNIIELFIYDICGKPIYFDLLKNICNNVSMVIGVFDVCRIDSFKKLQNLLNDLMKQFQITNGKNNSINDSNLNKSNVIGVILGNKCDEQDRRIVDEQEANKLAKKYANFAYFDCSAKKNINIEEVFTFLSTKFIEQFYED